MHHIIFTSLPKTLTGGSGYGIAAATPDCPRLAMEEVTKLAGYSEIYPATHPSKDQNPVNYFFVKQSGFHILGRLSVAPNDYSGRSNYLGQFFILGPDYLPDCGPVALLKALPFIDRFEGEARHLSPASLPNLPNAVPAICASWQRSTGDAGWAGVVADQLQSGSQVNILYGQPCRGLESLNLLADIFSLLPKASKWQTTFSTHVEGFPKGTATKIRMLQEGDRKTQDFQKQPHLFDLTKKGWGLATDSPLVNQARTGIAQEPVLKVLPQAPAWPQKQFTAPLQPDLDIGNDQDWYTIQPETLETKGKNPQKIHVQPAPPPVQGKKQKSDLSANNAKANFSSDKYESKGTSWLLVLSSIFIGILAGGGIGFSGGYLFRAGNEQALEMEKNKLKEAEKVQEKTIDDLRNRNANLQYENSTIEFFYQPYLDFLREIEEKQSAKIDAVEQKMEQNKIASDKKLTEKESEIGNLKKQFTQAKPEENAKKEKDNRALKKMQEIRDASPIDKDLYNQIANSAEISNKYKDSMRTGKDSFERFARAMSDPEFIHSTIMEKYTLDKREWAGTYDKSFAKEKKYIYFSEEKKKFINQNSLKNKLSSIGNAMPGTDDNSRDIILNNFLAISRALIQPPIETDDPNPFWFPIQTHFGNFSTFRLSLAIEAGELFPHIEKNLDAIKGRIDSRIKAKEMSEEDEKNIREMVSLFKIIHNYKKNLAPPKDAK